MLELLYKRRSTRRFLPKAVEPSTIDDLVQGVLLSPSGHNIKPWEFIVVDQRETITKLSDAKEHGSKFLAEAPLVLVILGDPAMTDVWIEDTAIAATICHLLAEDLGLGSCWVQIRNRKSGSGQPSGDYVRQVLGIPETYEVEALIALGYKAEEIVHRSREDLPENKVHRNLFGNLYSV